MKKTTRGYYLPGVMRIRIDTDKSITSLSEIDKDIQGAWHHEHIHYVQDITTISGVYSLVMLLARAKAAIEFVQNETAVVHVPIRGNIAKEIQGVYDFFSILEGDLELNIKQPIGNKALLNVNDFKINKIEFNEESRIRELFPVGKAQSVTLHLENGAKSRSVYKFGALAIREQIAHYMDRKFYKEPEGTKFPYRICEEVADYYCKGLGSQPKKLLALCEVSLSYPLPGWAFCKLLEAIRDESFSIEAATSDEIAEFGYKKLQEWGWNAKAEAESLIKDVGILAAQLMPEKTFEPTVNWLKYIVTQGLALRNQYPVMLTDLFIENSALGRSHQKVIELLGSPLVLNKKMNLSAIFPEALKSTKHSIYPQTLLALHQVLLFLSTGKVPCRTSQDTDRPPNDCVVLTGNNDIGIICRGKPWEHVSNPICPFGSFWKLLNFDKISFVDINGKPL